jgi:hypothetical protein
MSANVFSARLYQKECSMATARSKWAGPRRRTRWGRKPSELAARRFILVGAGSEG